MDNQTLIKEYFQRFFSGPAHPSDMREYLTEDFIFRGPLMSAESAADYIQQLEAYGDEFEIYAKVRKIIEQGDTVAALVDFQGPGGVIRYAQWFDLRDGKICRLEVIYDPRPFLEDLQNN